MAKVKWSKIKAEYIAGTMSYRELADKYKISFNTLKEHAVPEGWYNLRQQNNAKKTTDLVDAINEQDIKRTVNINDIADTLLEKIEVLAKKTRDPDVIKKLTSAIKDIKDIKDIKSDADKREQEARIERIRKACGNINDDDENTGVVLIPRIATKFTTPEE